MRTPSGWGWDAHFQGAFDSVDLPDCQPARVIEVRRDSCVVVTAEGMCPAQIAGRLLHEDALALPAVGDWVAAHVLDDAIVIQCVLERKAVISRKQAGKAVREQVLAANVDTVFVVTSFNEDFSPRRIERYLTMILESGARPIVLLNKADLAAKPQDVISQAENVALSVPVHSVCAHADDGLATLAPYLAPGQTIVLLGSSGVGKSTIVNRLMSRDVQDVREIRAEDARGRHTTTSRHLFRLPGGALVLDTPGLRELGLWVTETGLERAFAEIDDLASSCRFQDCQHEGEPDCAVMRAVEEGLLSAERLAGYRKLRREIDYIERRADRGKSANSKRRWRSIHKGLRAARKKGWLRDDR